MAVYCLNELADSARQAIAAGEPLAADSERVPGPDHPGALTSRGTARGYQGLSTPLAIPTTAEQTCGQAVYLCSAALGANARFCR